MIALEPFYIHVTPEESEIVQKLLFKCGYLWAGETSPEVILTDKPILTLCVDSNIRWVNYINENAEKRTITLEQLINEIESKLANIN